MSNEQQIVHRSVKNVIINDLMTKEAICLLEGPISIDDAVNRDIEFRRNYVEIDGLWFPKEDTLGKYAICKTREVYEKRIYSSSPVSGG